MLKLLSLKTILFSEIIIILAMIIGVVPQEFSYIILILFIVGFAKLSFLDSLKLFIVSIPFFIALPSNEISDSMSIWRVLVIVLFVKMGCKKYKNNRKQIWNDIVQNNKIKKIFFLVILFFFVALFSLIFAQSPSSGIKKMLFLFNIFLLFPIVIYAIKKKSDLNEIMEAIFYSSTIILSIGYFQFISTFFITLSQFWEFWANNVIKVFYGQSLSHLLSYSNTWFSYYNVLPPTLRMFSVLPDSHSFAMIIIISIPILLSSFFYHKKQNIYILFLLVLFLLAIFFSGSRGSWVGSIFALIAGLILFSLTFLKEKKRSMPEKIYLIILKFIKLLKSKIGFDFDIKNNHEYCSKLIIFSVFLFFILIPVSSFVLKQNQEVQIKRENINLNDYDKNKFSMVERAFSISDFEETSNMGRIKIWKETLISIKERPLFGVGFGNFNYILSESTSALRKGSSAHSIYLDIAAEIGILGLIIFLFLIVEILKMSVRLYFKVEQKYLKIFTGSFFVYFVWVCAYSIFDVVIFNDKVLMTIVIIISILYSLDKIEKTEYFKDHKNCLHNNKKM